MSIEASILLEATKKDLTAFENSKEFFSRANSFEDVNVRTEREDFLGIGDFEQKDEDTEEEDSHNNSKDASNEADDTCSRVEMD